VYKEWTQLAGSWKDMFYVTEGSSARGGYVGTDNNFYMCGRSTIGQLPFGSGTRDFGTPQLVPLEGIFSSACLDQSSTAVICGTDLYVTGRHCGVGRYDVSAMTLVTEGVPIGGWKKFGGGYDMRIALSNTGQLYDCVSADRTDKPGGYFYPLVDDTDWEDLIVQNYAKYAFKKDGTFWRWGNNNPYGALAIGTIVYRDNPVPILMNEPQQHATMFDGFHAGGHSYYARVRI
jgi:hypothetical protein